MGNFVNALHRASPISTLPLGKPYKYWVCGLVFAGNYLTIQIFRFFSPFLVLFTICSYFRTVLLLNPLYSSLSAPSITLSKIIQNQNGNKFFTSANQFFIFYFPSLPYRTYNIRNSISHIPLIY